MYQGVIQTTELRIWPIPGTKGKFWVCCTYLQYRYPVDVVHGGRPLDYSTAPIGLKSEALHNARRSGGGAGDYMYVEGRHTRTVRRRVLDFSSHWSFSLSADVPSLLRPSPSSPACSPQRAPDVISSSRSTSMAVASTAAAASSSDMRYLSVSSRSPLHPLGQW